MIRLKSSVCIEAPAERVWQALAVVEAVDRWVPAINHAYCDGEQTRGTGTIRICELDRFTVREEFLDWEDGRSFTYRATGMPLVAWATNHWSIRPMGGQTLVTSEAQMAMKGGPLERLLEPIMAIVLRLGLPNSLAPLKYYVETGQSFVGNPRHLPPARATC